MKKSLLILCVVSMITMFSFISSGVKVGEKAPGFDLKSTSGEMLNLENHVKDGAIVIFSCNHCPYSKAYEDRIISLDKKYKDSYPVVMINSNDPSKYEDDSFENMKLRSKEKGFTFPYLMDETQEIAKAYGALKTPHVYLIKKEGKEMVVKYIGAIDDNTYNAKKVKKAYVENAIANLKAGNAVEVKQTKAIGCGIKWK